jgi:hypothetical protein
MSLLLVKSKKGNNVKKLIFLCGMLSVICSDISCMVSIPMRPLPTYESEKEEVDIMAWRLGTLYKKMNEKVGKCNADALWQMATKIAELNMITLPRLAKRHKKALIAWFAENVPNFPESVELSDEARAQSERAAQALAALATTAEQALAALAELAVQVEQERAALAELAELAEQKRAARAGKAQARAARAARAEQGRTVRTMHVIHVPGARGFNVYLPAPVGAAPPPLPLPPPVLGEDDIWNPGGGNLDWDWDWN